jgi:hypothetical protein
MPQAELAEALKAHRRQIQLSIIKSIGVIRLSNTSGREFRYWLTKQRWICIIKTYCATRVMTQSYSIIEGDCFFEALACVFHEDNITVQVVCLSILVFILWNGANI